MTMLRGLRGVRQVITEVSAHVGSAAAAKIGGHHLLYRDNIRDTSLEAVCVNCHRRASVSGLQSHEDVLSDLVSAMGLCPEHNHDCSVLKTSRPGPWCDACVAPAGEVRL